MAIYNFTLSGQSLHFGRIISQFTCFHSFPLQQIAPFAPKYSYQNQRLPQYCIILDLNEGFKDTTVLIITGIKYISCLRTQRLRNS